MAQNNGAIQKPTEPFRRAITAFKNRLSQKEYNDFQLTTYRDLLIDIDDIQKRQEAQYNLNGAARIRSFIEAMEGFSRIVALHINVTDAVAFIWGPMRLMLHIASSWSYAMETLYEAYGMLGDTFPMIEQYEDLFGKDENMIKILKMLYCDILDFHHRALPFLNKKVWRQLFRSAWNDFHTRFDAIIARIKRHKKMLESQVQLIHFSNDEKAFSLLLELESKQNNANRLLEEQEDDRKRHNLIKVKEWIAAAPMQKIHEDTCKYWESNVGTGHWILEQKQVKNWMEEKFPQNCILWMHGIPGAGKTVLTSIIINSCEKIKEASTVYYYSTYDDETTNTSLSILKGLLSQLVVYNEDLVPHFLEKCRKTPGATLDSEKEAKTLIEIACGDDERKYIILDGLDECSRSERKAVLSIFTAIVRYTEQRDPGKVRVLVVSQTEPDIPKTLGNFDSFEILPEHNADDISIYVANRAQDLQQSFPLSNEQREYIEVKTKTLAAGQFIYASLVMDNLSQQGSLEDLVDELSASRFPKELTAAYNRILARIHKHASQSEWKHSKQILAWMVCAARAMKWHEIQAALSIDISTDSLCYERRLKNHVQEICGSLIKVYGTGRVGLVHSTARGFIIESGLVSVEVAECELTALCLQYLTFGCFEPEISDTALDGYIKAGFYAFQDYAVAKWQHHFNNTLMALPRFSNYAGEKDKGRALRELAKALECFTVTYQEEMTDSIDQQFTKPDTVPVIAPLTYSLLQAFEVEHQAQMVNSHMVAHFRNDPGARDQISLPNLASIHARIRQTMENSDKWSRYTNQWGMTFNEFYGDGRFKCSKLSCYNFHEGFVNKSSRQTHLDRHDRPFRCPVSDCSTTEFGFGAKGHLDTHIRNYHPELEDKSNSFPSLKPNTTTKFDYKCDFCPKIFTRNSARKDHILTHTGHKPHKCSHCGKRFTRKNDCSRHERSIHIERMR